MKTPLKWTLLLLLTIAAGGNLRATPANKAAFQKHFGSFLSAELNRCTTCHLPSAAKNPERLEEFPHNSFGDRLRLAAAELEKVQKPGSIAERLQLIQGEDADGDGVANQEEILLGYNPGDKGSVPSEAARKLWGETEQKFSEFLRRYKWEPFKSVAPPAVPAIKDASWAANEIDLFVAAKREEKGLTPRPDADKATLMRRVYIDLVGLNPTPEEQDAFLKDSSAGAYEAMVDRLLEDARYGERWGRHWMDVWRYSDWAGWSGGNQIRDSKPHIWRWRDWIVESLNVDKPYSQMVREMLAGDELTPEDTNAVRATGFLARNYKMLSREQWLEDTIKHTSQAFMGVTIGCAKCHDHMTDPISQAEYYQMRAIFEPHQVRTDRVPGELDRMKNGLVRVYDVGTNALTYFFNRGDERKPDTNRILQPGVPKALSWSAESFELQPVSLTKSVARPDRRGFVRSDARRVSEAALAEAKEALAKAETSPARREKEMAVSHAEAKHELLLELFKAEQIEEEAGKNSPEWMAHARHLAFLERKVQLMAAKLGRQQAITAQVDAESKVAKTQLPESKITKEQAQKDKEGAQKKLTEAVQKLAAAQKAFAEASAMDFKPRDEEVFPDKSTGRRAAFARWLTDQKNPLTARVAVNHIWLRHFGRGIVTTPENFGAGGNPPTHPELLDWLAAEFMMRDWSMKAMHRLILTSRTYRMASTPDERNAAIDQDNIYLWRMNSRRLDAELVRDNLLHVAGALDLTMGGPDIDNNLGMVSKRRSLYLRIAPEKEVEFLKIFDGPAVTECYQRHPSVLPQQALALANSELALNQAKMLAKRLEGQDEAQFIRGLFRQVAARAPKEDELALCRTFLVDAAKNGQAAGRARENLALVILNHNDFLTVR